MRETWYHPIGYEGSAEDFGIILLLTLCVICIKHGQRRKDKSINGKNGWLSMDWSVLTMRGSKWLVGWNIK